MLSRAHFVERIHCLGVLRQVHALQQYGDHACLVTIHYKLLITHRKTTFEPTRCVQHKVNTRESRRLQRIRCLVSRLSVRKL